MNIHTPIDASLPPPSEGRRGLNAADTVRVLMAAFAAASIGALMYNVLPLYLGSMEGSKTLASSQTGLIGTAFFLGFNIAGISAFMWIRKFQWRSVSLLSIPVLLLTLIGSDQISAFPMLLVVTVVCGIAFGVNYTIGSVIIGDTSRPERWYGVKVGLESLAGAAILFVLPLTPAAKYGFSGTVWSMAICIALLVPLLLFLPAVWNKEPLAAEQAVGASKDQADRPKLNFAAISCALAALLALFASVSAIWAFAERMGRLSGFDEASVGALLAITIITGIAGSIAVAVIGNRINAVVAFVGSALMILVALVCLTIKGNFALYALGNCLYMFGWAAGTPLAMAEIARLDHDGRYVALVAPAIGIGGMIGPGVAGWLLEISSPTAVLIYVATTIVASATLMIVAARLARVHPTRTKSTHSGMDFERP